MTARVSLAEFTRSFLLTSSDKTSEAAAGFEDSCFGNSCSEGVENEVAFNVFAAIDKARHIRNNWYDTSNIEHAFALPGFGPLAEGAQDIEMFPPDDFDDDDFDGMA